MRLQSPLEDHRIDVSPILLATKNGHVRCVEELIRAGAALQPAGRISTLRVALLHGSVKLVDVLLRHGARWTGESVVGDNAATMAAMFRVACTRGGVDMTRYFLYKG